MWFKIFSVTHLPRDSDLHFVLKTVKTRGDGFKYLATDYKCFINVLIPDQICVSALILASCRLQQE